MYRKVITLFLTILKKIKCFMSKEKEYHNLEILCQQQLSAWHDYLTNPTEAERNYEWFKFNSFKEVEKGENFVDFTLFGRRIRMSYEIDYENRVGVIKLHERSYFKEDHEGKPIWEYTYFPKMDVYVSFVAKPTFKDSEIGKSSNPSLAYTTMNVGMESFRGIRYVEALKKAFEIYPKNPAHL